MREIPLKRDRTIRSIATSYLSFAVNILVTLLLTPFLLYYLGQSGYGLWATWGSVLGYLGLFDLGLSYASTKFIAEYRAVNDVDRLNKFIATVFVAYLFLGGIVFSLIIFLSFYLGTFFHISPDQAGTGQFFFLIAGTNLALGLPLSLLSGVLFGYQRLDVLNLINVLGSFCSGFFSIMVLKIGLGLIGVAWVGFGINLFAAALKLFFIHRRLPQIRLRPGLFDSVVLKKTVAFSFYVFVISIGVQIVFNTDNIVISKFLGISAVAAYAIAFRLNYAAMQFVFKIADVFFPVFAELHVLREKASLKATYLEISKLSVAIAIPITIVIILFGENIIRAWVGQQNFVGMPTLAALAMLTLMHSFIHPGAVVLSGMGRIRTMTLFNVAEAVLNLAFSIALVLPLGVLGVALGTVIAQAFTNLWYIPSSAAREVELSLWRYIKEVFLRLMLVGIPVLAFGIFLSRLWPDADIIIVALFSLMLFLLYGLGFLILGITSKERSIYNRRIRTLLRIHPRTPSP